MRIACPHCGPRGHEEFVYHGDATVTRPVDGDPIAWADYVYIRDNKGGMHEELWYHAAGCHTWLRVTRDLTSHDIIAVRTAK
jgi:sarcosine oxidase subunit delta